jgi:excisionase family DNA binding protein
MEAAAYYTVPQASKLLAVHPDTVRRWIRTGHLRAARIGHTFRIPRKVVDRPRAVSASQAEEGFETFSLAGLNDVWDNQEDAVYDAWQKRRGVRRDCALG